MTICWTLGFLTTNYSFGRARLSFSHAVKATEPLFIVANTLLWFNGKFSGWYGMVWYGMVWYVPHLTTVHSLIDLLTVRSSDISWCLKFIVILLMSLSKSNHSLTHSLTQCSNDVSLAGSYYPRRGLSGSVRSELWLPGFLLHWIFKHVLLDACSIRKAGPSNSGRSRVTDDDFIRLSITWLWYVSLYFTWFTQESLSTHLAYADHGQHECVLLSILACYSSCDPICYCIRRPQGWYNDSINMFPMQ